VNAYVEKPFVEMVNIHKVYPDGTIALRGVDLEIYEGEILGLLGENGAGKTTLMKILSGLLKPTKGVIKIHGDIVEFKSPKDALRYGIGMVHQHFTLIPNLTVLENIVLGYEPKVKGLFIDMSKAVERLKKLMELTGFKLDPYVQVSSLPVGFKQMVEILKTLYKDVKLLILDEPTSSLTPIEVKQFFNALRKLKEHGVTVVFITHKIKEVLEITDRIVVLRKGRVEGVVKTIEANPPLLAKMMIKLESKPLLKTKHAPGSDILIVEDLWVRGDDNRYAVKGVSFKVREGEIYGIIGVEGSGQKELVEAIVGLRPYERGRIIINSKDKLLAYIPPDRTIEGLVLEMRVYENSELGIHRFFTSKASIIDMKRVIEHCKKLIEEYSIIVPDIKAQTRFLSGGNQQKLVVARELSKGSKLIIAVNPTRGLDIEATNSVRRLLLELRENNKAVLLVTSDIDEALEVCDRVGVIFEGKLIGEELAEALTEEKLGLLMGGVTIS
jgi:simple sugar transport system ATP-binding protein